MKSETTKNGPDSSQEQYYGKASSSLRVVNLSNESAETMQADENKGPCSCDSPVFDSHGAPLPSVDSSTVVNGVSSSPSSLRVVVVSDTHGRYRQLAIPPADILLHCGDCLANYRFSKASKTSALLDFLEWINAQPCSVKLFIGGNHDGFLEEYTPEAIRKMAAPAVYLCHESAIIEPIHWRVFGSPQSISNSVLSPFKAFQSRSMHWGGDILSKEPLRMTMKEERGGGAPALPLLQPSSSSSSLTVHVEPNYLLGAGPIDVLLTHQGLMLEGKSSRNNDLLKFISSVSPLRLHCGGHLHNGHGLYWLQRDESYEKSDKQEGRDAVNRTSSVDSVYNFYAGKQSEVKQCWKNGKMSLPIFHVKVEPNVLLSVNAACAPKHIFSNELRFPPTILDVQL